MALDLEIGPLQIQLVKMRSYWRGEGPNPIGLVSLEKGGIWTRASTQGKHHAEMKAKIRVMLL